MMDQEQKQRMKGSKDKQYKFMLDTLMKNLLENLLKVEFYNKPKKQRF